MTFFLYLLIGCNESKDDDSAVTVEDSIPAECQDVWEDELFVYLHDSLDTIAIENRPSWVEFYPHQEAFLLYATNSTASAHCYFLWADAGETKEYTVLSEPPYRPEIGPNISLPYGYLWPWTSSDSSHWASIIDAYGTQPTDLQEWTSSFGVQFAPIVSATRSLSDEWYAPFGQTATDIMNLQILVHEGFHVSMQSPSWMQQAEYSFPEWGTMAISQDLEDCYPNSIRTEQEHLVEAMSALFDDANSDVCTQAKDFVANRTTRWEDLQSIQVSLLSGESQSCEVAENHMELLEGLADYTSWFYLHNLGLASDTDTYTYMNAMSNTPYYRTGAIQLYILQHWLGDDFDNVGLEIYNATSVNEGSIYDIFRRETETRCSN